MQPAEVCGLRSLQRTTKRLLGKRHQSIELRRLAGHQPFAIRLSPRLNRRLHLAKRNRQIRPVLRRKLGDLLKRRFELQGLSTDKQQLIPEPLQLRCLRLGEHQPTQVLVFAVEHVERDDLVDRHDPHVAERLRKEVSKLVKRPLHPLPASRSLTGEDRQLRRQRGLWIKASRPHRNLHTRLAPSLRRNSDGRHKLTAGHQFCRQGKRMHPGSRELEITAGRVGRLLRQPGRQRGGKNRPRRRQQQRSQLGIGRARGQRGWLGRQHHSQLGRDLGSLVSLARRQPAVGDRPRGNHRLSLMLQRLAREVPHAGVACRIGVRVASKNLRRNIRGEVPPPVAGSDRQRECGHVTGMVAVARVDHQRDRIACLQWHRVRREGLGIRTIRHALSDHLSRSPATHLQAPGHPIATADVGPLHTPFQLHIEGYRADPRHEHPPVGSRMHADGVGPHRARNLHLLIRGVGEHRERIGPGPAGDKRPATDAFAAASDRLAQAHRRIGLDAEGGQPALQDPRIDRVGCSKLVDRSHRPLPRSHLLEHLGSRRQAAARLLGEGCPPRADGVGQVSDRQQRKIAPARRHQPGPFEDHEVVGRPIPGSGCRQMQPDHAIRIGRRHRHAILPAGHQRRRRFHPRRGTIFTTEVPADLAHLVESPEHLLPALDLGHKPLHRHTRLLPPQAPQPIEQQ